MDFTIYPLGDTSLIIEFNGSDSDEMNTYVSQAYLVLKEHPTFHSVEFVPAYTTLTIHFDCAEWKPLPRFEEVTVIIEASLRRMVIKKRQPGKLIRIPVCYEAPYSLDIATVAKGHHLTSKEVIAIHTSTTYHVTFLGFSPGFPFLRGLDSRLWTPRKDTPRLHVDAGSVGIANDQTGIYPMNSPGGWQIIGRTPVNLFSIDRDPPNLLSPGDMVDFFSISTAEFRDGWWER